MWRNRAIETLFVFICVFGMGSAVALADGPDPKYLWANFAQVPAQVQQLWLEMIDNKNGWELCRVPGYSPDGKRIKITACQIVENRILQWASFVADASPEGIRAANVYEVQYGRLLLRAVMWSWVWYPKATPTERNLEHEAFVAM
jgi:hypothetical protein